MPRKNTANAHLYQTDFPCFGQSRYEPVKREALDGKVWWCLWDNRNYQFLCGRYETRRALLVHLMINLKHNHVPFEPDDPKKGMAWLMRCKTLEQALSR